MLLNQTPIAIGFYPVPPFGNQCYSFFGFDFVMWFVTKFQHCNKNTNKCSKTNNPPQKTAEEVKSQEAELVWFLMKFVIMII